MLAAELRKMDSSAGSGRWNESTDGALGDAKFCTTERKAGCRTRTTCELSDMRSFNGIRIILLISTSSMPHLHVICNLQVRQKPQHRKYYSRSRATSSKQLNRKIVRKKKKYISAGVVVAWPEAGVSYSRGHHSTERSRGGK